MNFTSLPSGVLLKAGLVEAAYDKDKFGGFVTRSVVVFATRKGNPKNIKTWDDLIKDGVEVVTPNPFTSGGAQWNLLAAWQAQVQAGRSPEEATDYLARLIANVSVMDKGARDALTTFAAGQGDVLIGYENEAIFARSVGQPLDYVLPDSTILIENPIAVTLTGDALEPARAFVEFVYTPEVQAIYGRHGFRPEVPEVLARFDFPEPANLFTIEDMGGWAEVRPTFFDPETGIVAEIFRGLDREV